MKGTKVAKRIFWHTLFTMCTRKTQNFNKFNQITNDVEGFATSRDQDKKT